MTQTSIKSEITPLELESLIKTSTPSQMVGSLNAGNIQVIDVRTPVECTSEKIGCAINIPLDELEKRLSEIDKSKATVLICRSGKRAAQAASLLKPHGYQTCILEGGMMNWLAQGLTTESQLKPGQKVLPLDRQVQLTIGLLLLASVSAGFLVNHWFFLLPAFIGAGLTFAGLTGTCGLAIALSKAPWNKLNGKTNSCSVK